MRKILVLVIMLCFAYAGEMQSGLGCIFLGGMYFDGEGVAKNLSKAKELFGKACDLGIQASCDFYKELNKTKQ